MATKTVKPFLYLSGENGNAFHILGLAQRATKDTDLDWEAIKAKATSGDYDHLLQTMHKYFEVL